MVDHGAPGRWTAIRTGKARRWDYLFLVAVLGLLSFRVSRLDAFFGLAVVMLLRPRILRGADASVSPPPYTAGFSDQRPFLSL